MNHTRSAAAPALDFILKWDMLIRRASYLEWQKLKPSSCGWQDVAQEVRLLVLEAIPVIATVAHPQAFVATCVRRQARTVLRRLCRDEIRNGLVHIEDAADLTELFYSSTGGPSDDYLD